MPEFRMRPGVELIGLAFCGLLHACSDDVLWLEVPGPTLCDVSTGCAGTSSTLPMGGTGGAPDAGHAAGNDAGVGVAVDACDVDGGTSCAPFDECADQTDNCDLDATCADTESAFTCTCNAGFAGDGLTCSNADGCVDNPCNDGGDIAATCTDAVPPATGYSCSCGTGYAHDGTLCHEIDECANANGGCEQTCTNGVGDFTCSCDDGFALSVDGRSCSPRYIYWVERSNDGQSTDFLARADIDGANPVALVTSAGFAVQNFGSNLQVTADGLYWVERSNVSDFIVRTDLDGTNQVTLVTSARFAVQNFGSNLQVTADGLYWVERSNDGQSTDFIVRTDLDGTNPVTLVTRAGFAVENFGTSLQVTAGGLYWVERSSGGDAIARTDSNGTNLVTLFTSPLTSTLFTQRDEDESDTANLHVTDDGLYWTERSPGASATESIARASLDGTDKVALFTVALYDVQNFGSNLQVASDGIYWVEKSNGGDRADSIVRTDLDGTNKIALVTSAASAVQNFGSNLFVDK